MAELDRSQGASANSVWPWCHGTSRVGASDSLAQIALWYPAARPAHLPPPIQPVKTAHTKAKANAAVLVFLLWIMSGLFSVHAIEAAAVFQPAGSSLGRDQVFLAKLGQIYGCGNQGNSVWPQRWAALYQLWTGLPDQGFGGFLVEQKCSLMRRNSRVCC